MDLRLKGKIALVTGASYGLGNACARTLAEEGAEVVLCARNKDTLLAAADSISTSTNGVVHSIAADLTDSDQLENLAAEALRVTGGIDILVLSTGHPPTYPFTVATDEDWKQGLELILYPAITLTRRLLPGMRERKFGRLIYIGSIFGLEPEPSSIIQSTLRTGLNAFSKCIATEAAADGVTANVVCPGYFETPLVTTLAGQYAKQEGRPVRDILEDWKCFSPVQKFGKPEDLGAFVALLASPRGEFFNGTSFTIDGGAIKQY